MVTSAPLKETDKARMETKEGRGDLPCTCGWSWPRFGWKPFMLKFKV